MTTLNRNLAIAAAALLLLSVWSYWHGVTRAERFERGQRFLPNLNPDEIADIVVTKGGKSVTLVRSGEELTIKEEHGYRAKNESVNRLVRSLLELELEKEVGRGEDLAKELGIEPAGEDTIEVVLKNATGGEMVRLRVGKDFEGGSGGGSGGLGSYVKRLDQEDAPIYLTSARASLDTDASAFLRKELVDVPSSDIVRIEGPDFVFSKAERDQLALEGVPAGKRENSAQASKVKSALSRLELDKVYLVDDAEVRDLEWRPALRVHLGDNSGYTVFAGVAGERVFLRLSAFHDVDRIEITRDESEEELEGKADILKRNDEVQQFNTYHGSWAYEVTDYIGDKFKLKRSDLLEDGM